MALIVGTENAETLTGDASGTPENDDIRALGGADTVRGLEGADTISGGDGGDRLVGGTGDDQVAGDAGDDDLFGNEGNDTLNGGTGDDRLEGGAGLNELQGGDGNDTIFNGPNADTAVGGGGDDSIIGGGNFDQVSGGAGADTILGNAGGDNLFGEDGDDSIDGGAGVDVIDLGLGNDTVRGGAGEDTVNAGAGNDVMIGDAGADELRGAAGNDQIEGGAGSDRLFGEDGDDTVAGSDGADTIDGGTGRNLLRGGAGDDNITAARRGQEGDLNLVDYSDATGGVTIVFGQIETASGDASVGNDALSNMDGAVGSDFADSFTADENFSGQLGRVNEFEGRGGNDTVSGNGRTIISFASATAAVTVDIAAGSVSGDASVGTDRISGIGGVRGSNFNDRLSGSDNATGTVETFEGLAGNDTIIGRGGIDIALYDRAPNAVEVDLAEGTARDGQGGNDSLTGIEDVVGSAGDDTLSGDGAANKLEGRRGDDILTGRAGSDTLDGGQGDDSVSYADSTRGINVRLDNGTATDGLGGNDSLVSIEGVIGSRFADTIIGGDLDNDFSGGAGSDSLGGGTGNDAIDGGLGDDTALGDAGNDTLTGGDGDDSLSGGEGDDSVAGGTGGDTLRGGQGSDTLSGGSGADLFIGLAEDFNNDRITDFSAGDVIRISGALFTTSDIRIEPQPPQQLTLIRLDTDRDGVFETNIRVDGIMRGIVSATPGSGFTDIILQRSNESPVVNRPLPDITVREDQVRTINLANVFRDPDGDLLDISAIQVNGSPLPDWMILDQTARTLTFNGPDFDDIGFYQIRLTASDQPGSEATDTFNVTVVHVNHDPVVEARKTVLIRSEALGTSLGITMPTDQDLGDNLKVTITGLPRASIGQVKLQGGTPVERGQVISLYDLANLTYESGLLKFGDAGTLTYVVEDGNGGTARGVVDIIVTPVNHAPNAQADKSLTVRANSGETNLGIRGFRDVDRDELFIAITSIPTNGTIRTRAGAIVENFTTLSAAELTGLTFTPEAGVTGNAGTFSYRLQDNRGGIDTQTITIVIEGANSPPRVVAPDVSLDANVTVAAASRFVATDPDGNGTITAYRFSGGSAASGRAYWTLDGIAQTATFQVLAADLGRVELRTGAVAGNETLTVEAYDGTAYSPPERFTVTAEGANTAPTVAAGPVRTVERGGTIAGTDLVRASDDKAVVFLELRDDTSGTASGYLVYRGVAQPAGQVFAVAADDLVNLSFVGGTAAGKDAIMVRANDGELYSNWLSLSVTTSGGRGPVVDTLNRTMRAGTSASVADLIRARDPDGNTITHYRFRDLSTGRVSLSVANNQIVAAADLDDVLITAGTVRGTNRFVVQAFDGTDWSDFERFNVKVRTVTNSVPVVTDLPAVVHRSETVLAASLFRVTDREQDTIILYEFRDRNGAATSGYLTFDGRKVAVNSVAQINALNLSQLTFTGGSAFTADAIEMRAFDGISWSDWTDLDVTASNRAPTVTAYDRVLLYNTGIRALDAFSVKDGDGDTITKYRFRYAGTLESPSYISLNGLSGKSARLAPSNEPVEVAAANIGSVVFYTSNQRGENAFTVEVFDGTSWSDPTRFTIITRRTDEIPTVVSKFERLAIAEEVAVTALFEANDPELASIQRYRFTDKSAETASGYLLLDGKRVTAGTLVEVTALDLARVRFVAGAFDGALDEISVQVFDGRNWSTVTPVLVSTVEGGGNRAPEVTTTNTRLALNGRAALSTVVKATDADGDAIKYWRITDKNDDPTSAAIYLNGARVGQGTTITLTAAQFAAAQFIGGTLESRDEFTFEAFDGEVLSPPSQVVITTAPANRPPDVQVRESAIILERDEDGTITSDRTLLSTLFDVKDPDGDTITRYQFFDALPGTTTNGIVINGVRAPNNSILDVLPDQLDTVYVVAGRDADGNIIIGGNDRIWVRVFDGTAWSDWNDGRFNLTVSGPNQAPELTLTRDVVQLRSGLTGQDNFVRALPLFQFSDPDGDTITRVRITDLSTGRNSASIYLGSRQVKQGETIEVLAADFNTIFFVAGSDIGSDQFLIEAYDGKQFGAGETLTIRTRDNNLLPRVTAQDAAVLRNGGTLPIGPLIRATDPDGDEIERYQIFDGNTSGFSGYISVNGVKQPQGRTFEVTAAQLADPLAVAFIGGQIDRMQDTIFIRAFDGISWGDWVSFTITTFIENTPPVVVTTDRTLQAGLSVKVTDLFSVTDAQNDKILRYRFRDSSTDPNSARIVIDGTKQPQNQIIEVSAADLAKVAVLGGTNAVIPETFTVQVFDGQAWSAESTFNLSVRTQPNNAPQIVVTSANATINGAGSAKHLSPDLFRGQDADNDIRLYQVIDTNAAAPSGYLEFGGERQQAGTTLTLMVAELSNARFVGGAVGSGDTLLVRAFDGTSYSDWQRIDVRTLASV